MLDLAAELEVEVVREFGIFPKDHPCRMLWIKLLEIMCKMGTKIRFSPDYLGEKHRGLKATKDLKPGEPIAVIPYNCMIKQVVMMNEEWCKKLSESEVF